MFFASETTATGQRLTLVAFGDLPGPLGHRLASSLLEASWSIFCCFRESNLLKSLRVPFKAMLLHGGVIWILPKPIFYQSSTVLCIPLCILSLPLTLPRPLLLTLGYDGSCSSTTPTATLTFTIWYCSHFISTRMHTHAYIPHQWRTQQFLPQLRLSPQIQ